MRGDPGLTAIDAVTAALRWATRLRPIQTTVPSRLRHMEVSADGTLLYLAACSETSRELRPTVVDATTEEELTPNADREACGLAMFVPLPWESRILGRCEIGIGRASGIPLDLEIDERDPSMPVVRRSRATT